ncbi:flagellar biosynthetic protein FliR [Vibrio sp.]|uniref:Flagellar biosynthetic protein FliR n=1 Tax=Vibrio viridaestus TaxID=2487322 RepID=A0A3N9TLG6_9VIBR|nr:flagellar biosynthetic protein FliR [Vibrio viridaestus]MDC0611033.1 flagellar biosynthetic protein FliR [Vibrio sp.]RQW64445.1 flagellar type III secretion system protein FliR [Vibrio viridaestus]
MEYPTTLVLEWIANYFWPFVRISSMLMVMSVTGARFVPSRVRLYLSLAVTVAAMPAIPAVDSSIVLFSLPGFLVTFNQIVIGVAMGMITQFMVQTFVMLGQIIGMQASLGFASMVDPANGQNTPLLGQLFMFLATLFFLSSDGHLKLIQLVVYSFKTLPIGSGGLEVGEFREMATWLSMIFKVALNMSLSGIIALLTVNLSFGVMTRAAPQLNIFSLGFAFALLVGLLICWYLISGLYTHYDQYWEYGEQALCRMIKLNC